MNAMRWRVVRAAAMGIVLTVLVAALAVFTPRRLRPVAPVVPLGLAPIPEEWGGPLKPQQWESWGKVVVVRAWVFLWLPRLGEWVPQEQQDGLSARAEALEEHVKAVRATGDRAAVAAAELELRGLRDTSLVIVDVTETRAGFPMYAFEASTLSLAQPMGGTWSWLAGLRWPGTFAPTMPIVPRVGPMAVNVVFWGAMWWLAGESVRRWVRWRRVRRGECPECRYVIGAGAGCPECGAGMDALQNPARS